MNPFLDYHRHLTRRTFVSTSARGIGGLAAGSTLGGGAVWRGCAARAATSESPSGLRGLPHFAPKAKRVLCLFQSEGFSHVDLFDQKPTLYKFAGQEIPASVKATQGRTGPTQG